MKNRKWKNFVGSKAPPTYKSWWSMIDRCHNPNADNYSLYGDRGISVCDRWRNDYDAFIEDMGLRPEGLTIDRIDGSGNYEPGNCRWATLHVQHRNRKNNRYIEFVGRNQVMQDWANDLNISISNFSTYIRHHGEQRAIEILLSRMDF